MAGVELASFAGGIGKGLSSALNQYMRYKLAQQLAQQEMQLRQQLAEKQSQLQYENQINLMKERAKADYYYLEYLHKRAEEGDPVAQEILRRIERERELEEASTLADIEYKKGILKATSRPSERGRGRTAQYEESPVKLLDDLIEELKIIDADPNIPPEDKPEYKIKAIKTTMLKAEYRGYTDLTPYFSRISREHLGIDITSSPSQENIYQRPGLNNLFTGQPIPRAGLGLFPAPQDLPPLVRSTQRAKEQYSQAKLGALPFTRDVEKHWVGLTPEEWAEARQKAQEERKSREVAKSPFPSTGLW